MNVRSIGVIACLTVMFYKRREGGRERSIRYSIKNGRNM
jgi:hypothetical protein